MRYDYKRIYKLHQFCDAARFQNERLDRLADRIASLAAADINKYYAASPFFTLYVGGVRFDKGVMRSDMVRVRYNAELNIEPSLAAVEDDDLVVREYTIELLSRLDQRFISSFVTAADVYWKYSTNVVPQEPHHFVSTKNAAETFYMSAGETFAGILLRNAKTTNYTKAVADSKLSALGGDVYAEPYSIEDVGTGMLYTDSGYSYIPRPVELRARTATLPDDAGTGGLLTRKYAERYIRRDLSGQKELFVCDVPFDTAVGETVLSTNVVSAEMEHYKNVEDTTIDSGYSIKLSYASNDALNAKKAISLLKTIAEEEYDKILRSVTTGAPATDIGAMIQYYESKIGGLRDKYYILGTAASSNGSGCEIETLPLTFLRHVACEESVSIGRTNKILTKGDFLAWTKHCLSTKLWQ